MRAPPVTTIGAAAWIGTEYSHENAPRDSETQNEPREACFHAPRVASITYASFSSYFDISGVSKSFNEPLRSRVLQRACAGERRQIGGHRAAAERCDRAKRRDCGCNCDGDRYARR